MASNIISIVIYIALLFAVIAKYLAVNKMWVRKHENEVADSVSLSALVIDQLLTFSFLLLGLLHYDPNSANYHNDVANIIRDVVQVVVTVLIFFIGVGFWVNNGLSFIEKFKRSFKLESKEYKSLLKDAINPVGIKQIFKVLCMFAIIDNDLHEKEVELLKQFAKEHNLDYDKAMKEVQDDFQRHSDAISMTHLQHQVLQYLETSPPRNVVIWLQDLIEKIIKADDVVTEEEEIVSSEIQAALNNYLADGEQNPPMFHILLIPQDSDEENAVLALNESLARSKAEMFGSKKAYVADSYFSERFAEIVREKYVDLYKCFVTIEKY